MFFKVYSILSTGNKQNNKKHPVVARDGSLFENGLVQFTLHLLNNNCASGPGVGATGTMPALEKPDRMRKGMDPLS